MDVLALFINLKNENMQGHLFFLFKPFLNLAFWVDELEPKDPSSGQPILIFYNFLFAVKFVFL
jgi:hypothetical protein